MTKYKFLPGLLLMVALVSGLGCSVGTLLVRVPTTTPQPTKTPRPTFTFTPNWTPTPTSSPTATSTPVPPTITPTSAATQTPTPVPPTATRTRRPTDTPAPQVPTNTPTPAPPAATPTPQYAFAVKDMIVHNLGGAALETRITGFVTVCKDISKGYCDCADSYQIALIDPSGREHLSNLSGGRNHTTGAGLGDDHWFSAEVKFSPYTPGAYKARLVKNGVQQSPEVQFTLAVSPFQYVWLWFDAPPANAAARSCG